MSSRNYNNDNSKNLALLLAHSLQSQRHASCDSTYGATMWGLGWHWVQVLAHRRSLVFFLARYPKTRISVSPLDFFEELMQEVLTLVFGY